MKAYKPTAVIADEFAAQIAQLHELSNTQSAIINEKNKEIALLRQHVADLEAALRYAQSRSYADEVQL